MANRHDTKFVFSAVDATRAAFSSVDKRLSGLSRAVSGTTGKLLALAGVGGFGYLIKQSLAWSDELGKMSDRLNIATESIAAFQLQATLTGTSAETVNSSIERMTKRLGEAAQGTGAARKQLELMNLDVQALAGMKADEAYLQIAESISKMDTQTERAAATAAIFGREGIKMINMLEQGRGGFLAARKEAEDLGIALNRVDAAKVEMANDAWARAQTVIKGIANRITVSLAPLMKVLADRFTQASKDARNWGVSAFDAFDIVANAVGFVADAFRGLEVVWKTLEFVFKGMVSGILLDLDILQQNLVKIANVLPGIDIKPNAELTKWAQESGTEVNKLAEELNNLVMQPMPSKSIKKAFDDIKAEANKAAEEIAAKKLTANAPSDTGPDPALQKRFDDLQQSLLAEDELLKQKRDERLALLDEYANATHMKQSEHNAIAQQIQAEHETAMLELKKKGMDDAAKFQAMSLDAQAKVVFGKLQGMMSGLESSNRAMFEANKAAGIANAIVSTYQGAAEALKLGPILGPIMAAATVALGMMQVQKIATTSFGSKSAAGGGGGGRAVPTMAASPGAPVSPAAGQRKSEGPSITIHNTVQALHASSLTGQVQQEIADSLASKLRDSFGRNVDAEVTV